MTPPGAPDKARTRSAPCVGRPVNNARRRHALAWVPPADHPLWRAGCDWLGRDPETGISEDTLAPHRGEPRRRGFRATLKPPFALRGCANESWLADAMASIAAETLSFELPSLVVSQLGDFVALRLRDNEAVGRTHPLRRLADDCVRRLDPMRRVASAAETARRLTPDLSPEQRANLERWGCRYVFDSWRFHLALTDGLPGGAEGDELRRELLAQAQRHFAEALTHPVRIHELALFVEDAPGADFRLARRFEFAR